MFTFFTGNCSLCTAGTYQNQTGQDHCINCPAGYESASAMDHCNPCPEETYSTGDGQPCQPCVGKNSLHELLQLLKKSTNAMDLSNSLSRQNLLHWRWAAMQ